MLVIFFENVKFCLQKIGSTNGVIVEGPDTLLCFFSVFCKFLSPQYV